MQKLVSISILALTVTLAACSHGGGGSLPASQNVATNPGAMSAKIAKETQRNTSSFVASKHPGYLAETSSAPNWPSGISEAGALPVPGGMFDIVNQYNTTEAGQYVTVYAGSRKDTGEGVLLVVRRTADLHTASAHTYIVAQSAIRIQSANGGQLQLQTLGGRTSETIPLRMPL
jgi:hypothetical protein